MDCIGIDYRPLTRQLVLTFESSGSEVMNDLKLELTFEGAEIYQWEGTDQEDWSEPVRRLG
jgi:hypothetical protein